MKARLLMAYDRFVPGEIVRGETAKKLVSEGIAVKLPSPKKKPVAAKEEE